MFQMKKRRGTAQMKYAKVFMFIVVFILMLNNPVFASEKREEAVIQLVEGDVSIQKKGGSESFKALAGMVLGQGDTVKTGENSTVELSYKDGSKITVGSKSEIIITKLSPNQDESKSTKLEIWLGKVWNTIKNLLNLNNEYTVDIEPKGVGEKLTEPVDSCAEPCTSKKEAELYLTGYGYNVLSHSSLEAYTLTKERLREYIEFQTWLNQGISPDGYIGKKIYRERFVIEGHPFDHWDNRPDGTTSVVVMVANGKVIGGTSMPVLEHSLYGGNYPLHGSDFKESGPTYSELMDAWEEKYGEILGFGVTVEDIESGRVKVFHSDDD